MQPDKPARCNKDPEQPKEKKERAREGAKQCGNMLIVYLGADKAGSPMWTWRTSQRSSPNTAISFPLPRTDPTGQDEWGPSLTQALSSDLQGILCGKQGLGEADEDLGPGRAAVISPWLPTPYPSNPRHGRHSPAHLVLFRLVAQVPDQHSHPILGPSCPRGPCLWAQ